jgi:hypothetical protein
VSLKTRTGADQLQRGFEQHCARAAAGPRAARLADTDIRILWRLVEPGAWHGLLAATAEKGK